MRGPARPTAAPRSLHADNPSSVAECYTLTHPSLPSAALHTPAMAPLIGIVNIEQGAFPTILRPSESTRGAVRTRFLLPGGRHTKAEVAVVQSTPKAKGRKTEAA